MTLDEERQYIETRFSTNWGALTPVGYENFPFRLSPTNTEFVELFVIHNTEENISIGDSPNYRRYGIININVYVRKQTGAKRIRTLCDTASAIFRNTEFNSITCLTAQIEQVGDSDIWYKYNISISFYTTNS